MIIINDGPIWSIKFHPSESPIEKRIGLLAVTTANQSVLVYSLPYINNEKSIVLQIEPNLVCKLDQNGLLFNEEYLLQTSKVAWFQKNDCDSVLAAGYISGAISVWNISSEDFSNDTSSRELYPHYVIQAHLEPVTVLDFKVTLNSEFHLLTGSADRKLKVFTFDKLRYQEINSTYSASRVLCAEWWMHWPGFVIGYDDSLTFPSFTYRQPLEFGMRNTNLLNTNSTIIHLNINHWLNFAMFVTDSGDVIGCNPNQLYQHGYTKDKWSHYKFSVFSSTDYNKITTDGVEEIGVVFDDFKVKPKLFLFNRDNQLFFLSSLIQERTNQPKKFRVSPTDRINELLINQVCFNRNEKSYRFYALGYETGFVRIRYLKNSK